RGAVWNAEIRNAPYADAASSTERLLEAIDENREPWVAATDEVTWKTARANALNLIDGFKFLEYYAQGNFGRGNALYREPGMIRNVGALASNLAEGERLLLIGHNLHCSKKTPASGANTIEESPALGTAIARSQEWGHKYLVLAQIYHRGEHIRLSARLEKSECQSSESSVAGMRAKITDAPALLIGTDATEPPMHQQIDLAPFGASGYPLIPAEQFDALPWLDDVSATTPRRSHCIADAVFRGAFTRSMAPGKLRSHERDLRSPPSRHQCGRRQQAADEGASRALCRSGRQGWAHLHPERQCRLQGHGTRCRPSRQHDFRGHRGRFRAEGSGPSPIPGRARGRTRCESLRRSWVESQSSPRDVPDRPSVG